MPYCMNMFLYITLYIPHAFHKREHENATCISWAWAWKCIYAMLHDIIHCILHMYVCMKTFSCYVTLYIPHAFHGREQENVFMLYYIVYCICMYVWKRCHAILHCILHMYVCRKTFSCYITLYITCTFHEREHENVFVLYYIVHCICMSELMASSSIFWKTYIK